MTSATILADSISDDGHRLTTFQVRAPRFILAQVSKHRCFSISCRSSRAVPVGTMLAELESDPVLPRFGRNARGMVARDDLAPDAASAARRAWLLAMDDAIDHARHLAAIGAAKEVVNRVVEPYGWFDAVISSTDYLNFFALRIHPDAQREIRELAVLMARAYRDATPVPRSGEADWHLPYVTEADRRDHGPDPLARLSAARCARVSYRPHDADRPDAARDFARADLLERSGHWVPFEHAARPALGAVPTANYRGWRSARADLRPNVHAAFDFATLDRPEEVAS